MTDRRVEHLLLGGENTALQSPYLGRDVFGSKFSFDMGVIQLTDEGISPCLAGMSTNVPVILSMAFPPLLIAAVSQK